MTATRVVTVPGRVKAAAACCAITAYLLRFASSWAVLAWTADRSFDPHGFGLLGDAMQLSAMALPLLGLLVWMLRRRLAWRSLFAPASSVAWTAVSVVTLLLIGAPTLGQAWAVILLPVAASWPVLASSAAWFTTVAILRAMAVQAPRCVDLPRQ